MILNLFEFLTFLSFFFAMGTHMFWELSNRRSFLLFLAILTLLMVASKLRKKHRAFDLLVLLAIPIGYYLNLPMLFVVPLSVSFLLYLNTTFNNHNDQSLAPKLIIAFLILIIGSYFFGSMRIIVRFELEMENTIYTLLFILSGILFLRTLRHQSTGMDDERIHKNNIFYVLIITLVSSFLLFSEQVMELLSPVKQALEWISIKISDLLAVIIHFFLGTEAIVTSETLTEEVQTLPETMEELTAETSLVEPLDLTWMVDLLSYLLWGFFIFIICFVIYRLFFKVDYYSGTDNPGDIQRTKLEPKPKHARRREKRPEDPFKRIGYYYRELMRKIDLETQHPLTEDVERLAKEKQLDSRALTKLYRAVRYDKESATEEDARRAEEFYQDLTKK